MYDAHDSDALAAALLDLVGALNSPRQDDVLLNEARVVLDRALFPLLVRIGFSVTGGLGVVELAEQVGRDHSTVSRQVAKLEKLGLVARRTGDQDQRVREACITDAGRTIVQDITQARRRLLDRLLEGWSAEERRTIARLNRKLADAMAVTMQRR